MTTKELIEHLSKLPQDIDVVIEVGGCAMYVQIGTPYMRNLGTSSGFHTDCVCIGGEVKGVVI